MSKSRVRLGGVFTLKCFDPAGNEKWEMKADNLVVNEGLQDILDAFLLAGTQRTNWYVGLTDSTPTPAAGDTLASHVGWTELDEYTEGARQGYTGVRSGQSVTNSASKASFSINATVTCGGAFLSTVATGTAGILLCVAAATGGDKSAGSGDTIQAQYDFSAADDGA